jgi:hypothetical protein
VSSIGNAYNAWSAVNNALARKFLECGFDASHAAATSTICAAARRAEPYPVQTLPPPGTRVPLNSTSHPARSMLKNST